MLQLTEVYYQRERATVTIAVDTDNTGSVYISTAAQSDVPWGGKHSGFHAIREWVWGGGNDVIVNYFLLCIPL